MSEIDTRLEPVMRESFVAEIRDYLPGFLHAQSRENRDPLRHVEDLLRLDRRDLSEVIALHLCLSSEVQRFADSLLRGLRGGHSEAQRRPELKRVVDGPIDWPRTLRTRMAGSGDTTQVVVRPVRKAFDTPPNRALRWVADAVTNLVQQLPKRLQLPPEARAKIDQLRHTVEYAARRTWLRSIEPEYGPAARAALYHNRRAFYRVDVAEAALLLHRFDTEPTDRDVTELLIQTWFRPERDWQLFELVVALRLVRAFGEALPSAGKARLLVGGPGRHPYARFALPGGDEVRLWYQGWPKGGGPSLRDEVIRRQALREAGPLRPDLVIERVGNSPRAIVIEAKASAQGSYLQTGLAQLLAYLKDREALTDGEFEGWLVAPAADAFDETEEPDGQIWLVTAEAVATAAVRSVIDR